jgi:hypothetical protein
MIKGQRERAEAAGGLMHEIGLTSDPGFPGPALGKLDVLTGSISKSRVSGVETFGLMTSSTKLHVDRVLGVDLVLVHRLEIDRDEERPFHLCIDPFAALDAEDFRDLQQLHARVHHHLFDARRSDLGLSLNKEMWCTMRCKD